MNDRSLERSREICGWFRSFCHHPDGQLIAGWHMEDPIEVVLTRTTLVVDQLRYAETVDDRFVLRFNR